MDVALVKPGINLPDFTGWIANEAPGPPNTYHYFTLSRTARKHILLSENSCYVIWNNL